MAENNPESSSSKPQRKQNRAPRPNHTIKKRPPQKPQTAENVIYISSKANIKALQEKCSKLILNNTQEILIYCLGAAIQRGILLALQLSEKHLTYEIDVNTLTTDLVDDLEPVVDEADYEIQKRQNSALRIRMIKKKML